MLDLILDIRIMSKLFQQFILGSILAAILIFLLIKNSKLKKILLVIVFITALIFLFFFCGIVVPYSFLTSLFENALGFIFMFIIVFAIWMFFSLFIHFKNHLIFLNNKEKEIYIRDVDVEYSPAVLSYLINNKIETKKDLSATLLNLCAKNILKIETNNNGNINIIDLKNEKEVEKLASDEKYAYKMLTTKVTNSKILSWKNKVKEEYEKYKFSKPNKINTKKYSAYFLIVLLIAIYIVFVLLPNSSYSGAQIMGILMLIFLSGWEFLFFSIITSIFKTFIETEISNISDKEQGREHNSEKYVDKFVSLLDKQNNGLKNTYTKKGAKEYNKWKKFEKFIEDFSLIKEKEHESIVIWGKYLSYSIALGINKKCDNELYEKIKKQYSFDYDILSNTFDN